MGNRLKIVISVLALLVVTASGITAIGNVLVPQTVSELLLALGDIFAACGVQLFRLPPIAAMVCGRLALVLGVFVASHAATWGSGTRHFEIIGLGFTAALLGALGRLTVPKTNPPPTA